jgi:hypothetical protein
MKNLSDVERTALRRGYSILTGPICIEYSVAKTSSIKIVIFKRSNYSVLGILKRCYLRGLLQIDGPSEVTCRSGGI